MNTGTNHALLLASTFSFIVRQQEYVHTATNHALLLASTFAFIARQQEYVMFYVLVKSSTIIDIKGRYHPFHRRGPVSCVLQEDHRDQP